MSHSNPHFQQHERASYEFAYLLRNLPRHLMLKPLTEEQHQMLEAADTHAENYSQALLHGLESMGRVIWCAGVNKVNSVETNDFANVGMLVTELALQLQFLNEFRGEAAEVAAHRSSKGQRK